MKLLRNAWVSGALAAVAVLVVIYQFVPQHWARASAAVIPTPATPPPPAPEPVKPQAEKAPAEAPELPPRAVERAAAQARFAHWAAAPDRDPFWLLPGSAEAAVHRFPSPALVWKLKAIWRQTDGRLATIDNRIYAEGDSIQGYRIVKIDADRVLFEGPDGPEVLTFTPAAAAKAAPRK